MSDYTKEDLFYSEDVKFQRVLAEVSVDDYLDNEVDENLIDYIRDLNDYCIGVSTSTLPPHHEFYMDEIYDFKYLMKSYDFEEIFHEHIGYGSDDKIKYMNKEDACLIYAAVKVRYLRVDETIVALMKKSSSLNKIPPLENVILINHIQTSVWDELKNIDPFADMNRDFFLFIHLHCFFQFQFQSFLHIVRG